MSFQYLTARARKNKRSLHISPAKSHLSYLHFNFECLDRGNEHSISTQGYECLITLLKGEVEINTRNGCNRLGPRKDVFSSPSTSFFVANNGVVRIRALRSSEIIIVKTQCSAVCDGRLIKPRDVRKRRVGKETYLRSVHDILKEEDAASVLLAGETFNKPGKWSSYPPAKHDRDRLPHESKLEEVYFFKVKPENRFGIIRLYGIHKGKVHDQPYVVQNNDCAIIPFGYHPVCAAPDTELYYFWSLAGKKRKLRCSEDRNYL